MKYIVSTILTFTIMSLIAPLITPLQAQQGQILDREKFLNIYQKIVFENVPWDRANLQIDNFTTRPGSITVPAGEIGYRFDDQIHPNYLGRKTVDVTIFVEGKEYGTVKMSGDMQLYDDVVCLDRKMNRNDVITTEDINIVWRNISMLGADILTSMEDVVGKKLKVSQRAGAVLYEYMVEDPPLVKRGDVVTILVETDNLRVTTPGLVRTAGAKGDLVRVKNLMSRREIFARVASAETVRVDL